MNIMTRNLQAAIFPHASISEENLKKVLSLFEKVILFQPWFMDTTLPEAEDSAGMVQVLNPPERLKPEEDIRSLLAEYRQWTRVDRSKGFAAFLAYAADKAQEDPRIYEIRGMIRNKGGAVKEDEKAEALKWHLTLHLAEELEQEQESAKTLLRALGALESPLKGAVEEGEIPTLPSDIPGLEKEPLFTEQRLERTLEAWLALYGESVPERGPLVTVKPEVMQYLAETWEEFVLRGQSPGLPKFTFLTPDLSTLDRDELVKKREDFLAGSGLRQALAGFCLDPARGFSHPEGNVDELPVAAGSLLWTFVHLPSEGQGKLPQRYGFMKGFSGKIIALVKDAVQDEP